MHTLVFEASNELVWESSLFLLSVMNFNEWRVCCEFSLCGLSLTAPVLQCFNSTFHFHLTWLDFVLNLSHVLCYVLKDAFIYSPVHCRHDKKKKNTQLQIQNFNRTNNLFLNVFIFYCILWMESVRVRQHSLKVQMTCYRFSINPLGMVAFMNLAFWLNRR